MKDNLTFIEAQLPVSKLSKESYKERKANYSQTLTGLGKWWGRKPLIMVRATILGLLMPASEDAKKDREIYLKALTMDDEGLWLRKTKNIPLKQVYAYLDDMSRQSWFKEDANPSKPQLKKGTTKDQRVMLQKLVFDQLGYDKKLAFCDRPEQIGGPSESAWKDINNHLQTNANNLKGLINELGIKRFGHAPRVGDAFCGGGSIPFEAARIGCEAYASDLNPVAALLNWGAFKIVGGGEGVAKQVKQAQEKVFNAVDKQITEWGIEHNEKGWRADAYLYCAETKCPECNWSVPLAPAWVIGEKTHTIAELKPNEENKRFEINIQQGVSESQLKVAKQAGTVKKSRLECPHCGESTSISHIRGVRRGDDSSEYGLRLWENDDIIPRHDDTFQERLYCIRWVETYLDVNGKVQKIKHYLAPNDKDIEREERIYLLLNERFHDWQKKGHLPTWIIDSGYNTDQPIRERGWSYWHHLFNHRQLLTLGLFGVSLDSLSKEFSKEQIVACLFGLGRCADYNSKLSRWHPHGANEKSEQVFSNQALNTLDNYGVRALNALLTSWKINYPVEDCSITGFVDVVDARLIKHTVDCWITDPPYADAVNYDELSEFFLSWYQYKLPRLFPEWYSDSKRALAIRGSGKSFRNGMVDVYHHLSEQMPDDGLQVVMFTHQDAGVWADLTLILWAAGLHVTAAWTIATETETALKEGNYVQGTVLMVLRKQKSDDVAFLDEVVPEIEAEVESQLETMLRLEDMEDPNFSDSDYQLAAYAAALRVLTQYKNIEDIDVNYELSRERSRNEVNPIEKIIENAVKTASNYLVPKGLTDYVWKRLLPEEKLYLKGLEVESHGEFRSGVYQEFARGFGVRDYHFMIKTGKANQTRLKTASEFKRSEIGDTVFGNSLVRHALFAIYQVVDTGETQNSMTWLRSEVDDYWSHRETISIILRFILSLSIKHWEDDNEAASLIAGTVENDHI